MKEENLDAESFKGCASSCFCLINDTVRMKQILKNESLSKVLVNIKIVFKINNFLNSYCITG